jgi:hypothetical protein
MNDTLALLFVIVLIVLVVVLFVRLSIVLRRRGGSLTTTVLGATDGFMAKEKSKAAETIVNENAGKYLDRLPSSDPKDKGDMHSQSKP